jgi:hypothetical protein
MLPSNLAVLKKRFPGVLGRILAVGQRECNHYSYDDSGDSPSLLIKKGDRSFPAYGRKSPAKLIERWFKGLKMQSESIYGITGFGDGSHIRYFMKNSASGTHFMVLEQEPALLRETFSRFDLSDVLSCDRFMLGTGVCDDIFFNDLQGAALLGVSDVNVLLFSPLHSTDENYYDHARNELVRQYLVVRPLMEVNLRTGVNLQENTFENLPHMATAPDVGLLGGLFEDTPFILIGAGPSLDESIDFLREVQDRAIIVASNSPYRKLINSGIRPHLVVTADPLSPTLAGFQNVSLEGVPLACPFSAYPEIVRKFSGRILSWVTFNPIIDILKNHQNLPQGTPIMEQGTVSGCVLDLSKLFGCKKVLFIGQDMAARSDGKYYTDDSFYADSGNHYSSNEKGHWLPGNTNDKVLVEGRLYVYLKTFEKFIKENPEIEYRNLSRTGVKIENVPYLNYDDALTWVGESTSSSNFDSKIKELLDNQNDCPQLEAVYADFIEFAQSLLQEALSLAIEIELLPEKYSGSNYSSNKKVLELLNSSNKVNDLIDSNKMFWSMLLDGRTKVELAVYKRAVRDINFPNPNWSALQKNKEYFWAISEGCHWVLNAMEEKLPHLTKQTEQTA